MKGVSVPLKTTISDCQAIIKGEYDQHSEDQFYMKGALSELGMAT